VLCITLSISLFDSINNEYDNDESSEVSTIDDLDVAVVLGFDNSQNFFKNNVADEVEEVAPEEAAAAAEEEEVVEEEDGFDDEEGVEAGY
jgi:hypothetical protein